MTPSQRGGLGPRREGRELAMKLLYRQEITGLSDGLIPDVEHARRESVDFAEGLTGSLFGIGTTISGFNFDSMFGPMANFQVFQALDISGKGSTGQVQTIFIPEPGTMALLAAGLFAFVPGVARGVRKRCRLST